MLSLRRCSQRIHSLWGGFLTLFNAPRVDEELSRAMGISTRPPFQSSELKKALDALCETSMASWRLGWYLTALARFLKEQNLQEPAIHAVIHQMHAAVQESRRVSVTGTSTAIAASRHMVLNSPACCGWQALRPQLLESPNEHQSLWRVVLEPH